jgi:hypothetical protein
MSELKVEQGPLDLDEVFNDPWNYILCRHGDRYFLSVACGSAGVFTRNMELTSEEFGSFQEEGMESITALARTVFNNPQEFDFRHIDTLTQWPINRLKNGGK